MAQLNSLSQMLEGFKNFYDGEMQSVSGVSSSVASSLTGAANTLNDAIALFSKASSDSAVSSLTGGVSLAKEGLERVKSHVEGDIASLLGDAGSLRSGTIQKILDKIEEGKAWKESSQEKNEDGKLVTKQNDQAKINEANAFIDRMNQKGEAQLQAMAAAINGVAFGVTGNMTIGGSLGKSITYADGYHFSGDEWEKEHPEEKYEEPVVEEKEPKKLNPLQEAGCAAVGFVSSVAKVGEGIVDAGATLVGGVCSILGSIWDFFGGEGAGDGFRNVEKGATEFAKQDLVGSATDAIVDATSGLTGVTSEDYHNSTGEKVGSFVGTTVAHGALWVSGAGILSAVSAGGNEAETALQNGQNTWRAIGAGTVKGLVTYGVGKFATKVGNKFSSWVSDPAKGGATIVGKVYNAATTSFGRGWNAATTGSSAASSAAKKVISIAASPARGVAKMINSGANTLNKMHIGNRAATAATASNNSSSGSGTPSGNGTPTSNGASSGTPSASGTPTSNGASSGTPSASGTPTSNGTSSGTPSGSGTPSSGGTPKAAGATTVKPVNNPSSYGINQSAFDELVADGFTPGTTDFINEATARYAGAVVPKNPGVYGINQSAFDELVADGYTPGTQDFLNEAASRFVGTGTTVQ